MCIRDSLQSGVKVEVADVTLSGGIAATGEDGGGLRARDADPAGAGAWQGWGNVYFSRSAWEQALTAYRRALTLDANLAGVAYNMAKVHLQTAAPDSAVAALALALSTAPDDVEALYLLGELHRRGGRGAEARKLYERAISLDPETERAGAVRRLLEGR